MLRSLVSHVVRRDNGHAVGRWEHLGRLWLALLADGLEVLQTGAFRQEATTERAWRVEGGGICAEPRLGLLSERRVSGDGLARVGAMAEGMVGDDI